MKIKFFALAVLLAASATSYSQLPPEPNPGGDPLPIIPEPGSGNEGPGSEGPIGGNSNPKSPILVPEVYLNGNVLTFDEALEGTTVQLLDEDDNVVFSDFIEENQTSIVFPTTLFGSYKLYIICSDITFYCEIEL